MQRSYEPEILDGDDVDAATVAPAHRQVLRKRRALVMFLIFAPLVLSRVNVLDGCQSIRRSYTPSEFSAVVSGALGGTPSTWRCAVSPLLIRQVSDISFLL